MLIMPAFGQGNLFVGMAGKENLTSVYGPVHMIPLTGTSRLPMISPPIYFPIKFCIVFI
jgi:hypothetical protein